jgi:hypothetical protein
MADDRMRNDDRDRNIGGSGTGQKDSYSQQSPGRKQQDDMSTGQRGGGQQNQPGNMEDDDLGTSHKTGTGQGGRQGQNR